MSLTPKSGKIQIGKIKSRDELEADNDRLRKALEEAQAKQQTEAVCFNGLQHFWVVVEGGPTVWCPTCGASK